MMSARSRVVRSAISTSQARIAHLVAPSIAAYPQRPDRCATEIRKMALDTGWKIDYNARQSSIGEKLFEGDAEGMVTIICDSCRKQVTNPERGENYFSLLHKHLCKACYKELLETVEDTMQPRRPHYTLAGYKRELSGNLSKMTR